ncbi:MAG: DUF5930 domain-containing protein [Neomegalonema sp.]|nr:DUF5930 domain-containing protein [Neomegalonema sp.]
MMSRVREFFDRYFPERELYVRSQGAVRYVTLTTRAQLFILSAVTGVLVWAITFTALSFMSDTVIASRDQELVEVTSEYKDRIKLLEGRYARLAAELSDSERRLDEAIKRLRDTSTGRTGSSAVEDVLQGRIEASARRLADVTSERDKAQKSLEEMKRRKLEIERRLTAVQRTADERQAAFDDFTSTFKDAVSERDKARETVLRLSKEVETLAKDMEAIRAHQKRILEQIEEATQASLAHLEKILKKTGVDVDRLLKNIERTYSGKGGPFIPIAYRVPDAARGFPLDEAAVARILDRLQRASAVKIALERLPLRQPVRKARRSSGFGPRKHPITGRWALHAGLDFAARTGTPIYAPVSGTVSFAGWQGGYGRVLKIKHAFGYTTVYAHTSAILVSKGQSVTAGQLVAKIGSTGRSTGPHLHYEIRRNNKPLNPWRFIKAGHDVF